MSTSYPPSTSGARRRGIQPATSLIFIPAPLGMIGDVSLPLASGATHERTRDGARRAVRRRRRGHAHRARHLVTVDFRFERRSRGHRRRPRACDASSGFRRGFFLRERTRALPKSVPRDGTESGVGAGDSRRRLKPVTRYSGEKIRALVSSEAPDVRNTRACGTRIARARGWRILRPGD